MVWDVHIQIVAPVVYTVRMRPDRVAAVFQNGKIKPRWIDKGGGQRIDIVSVDYEWQSHVGAELMWHYSVTDDRGRRYELIFNTSSMLWTYNPV